MFENGNLPYLRTICVGETDQHFFVAAKAPFDVESEAFEMLDFMAKDVRELREGSQVFVFDRKTFGANNDTQQDGVIEHVNEVAEEIGAIAIYPTIRRIEVANG